MSTIEVGRIRLETAEITKAVDVSHDYYNAGEKEIKYITFSYVPYNAVNDIVACTASGNIEVSIKVTGPVSPKHCRSVKGKHVWFNPTVKTVVLTKIHIQYMDNSEELIEGKDVVSMEDPNSTYYKAEEKRRQEAEKRFQEDEKRRQEERKQLERVLSYGKKLSAYNKGDNIQTVEARIAEVFVELKNDEETLLEAVSKAWAGAGVINGYLIGDYIEKEHSANEDLVKYAVALWKKSIGNQNKYYVTYAAYIGYPKKYAKKIKKSLR